MSRLRRRPRKTLHRNGFWIYHDEDEAKPKPAVEDDGAELTTLEMAKQVGVNPCTLHQWRMRGLCPAYQRDDVPLAGKYPTWWYGPYEQRRVQLFIELRARLGISRARAVIEVVTKHDMLVRVEDVADFEEIADEPEAAGEGSQEAEQHTTE